MTIRALAVFLAVAILIGVSGCGTSSGIPSRVSGGSREAAYNNGIAMGRADAASGLPRNPAPHSRALPPSDVGAFNAGYMAGYEDGGRVPAPAAETFPREEQIAMPEFNPPE